jgi:cell division protein FtsQ
MLKARIFKFIFLLLNLGILGLFSGLFKAKVHKLNSNNISICFKNKEEVEIPIKSHELIELLIADNSLNLYNTPVNEISGEYIKGLIKKNIFIKEAVVYKDYRKNLNIEIWPRTPIARLIDSHKQHLYIDKEGFGLPVIPKYSHRLIILYDTYDYYLKQKKMQSPYFFALLELLEYINKNKFLNSNIESMEIDKRGDININVQMGNYVVNFGQPKDIRKKFDKLILFYKSILPHTGWNRYKRVTLKFDKQIVCELT